MIYLYRVYRISNTEKTLKKKQYVKLKNNIKISLLLKLKTIKIFLKLSAGINLKIISVYY